MVDAGSHLARAREHFDGSRWQQACAEFAAADHLEPLGVDDLDRSAEAAQISGRIDEAIGALARAFEMHASAGEIHAAARAAYWLWSAHVFARGEFALANGWVVRARTLADQHGSASDGWLLVPEAYAHLGNADFEAAAGLLHRAVERGIAAGDVDLVTIASVMRGRALLKSGAMDAGLSLLDEAMVRVLTRMTSPRTTSVMFCAAIGTCYEVQELRRACEWSVALDQWLEELDRLEGAYFGNCRIYRAMLMRLRGDWPRASAEFEQACRDLAHDGQLVAGHAWYELGEMRRLRGDPGVLEAYERATSLGRSTQPGLAKHHLGLGAVEVARAGLRRALAEQEEPLSRFLLLPTLIAASIEADGWDEARASLAEMAEAEQRYPTPAVRAQVAEARGALALAEGRTSEALACLRKATQGWRELSAPYETAQASVLVAAACQAVDDEEGAAMELRAALNTFARLGARPDVTRVRELLHQSDGVQHRLSPRELEVLRLVAAGKTNAAIAAELFLSERTIHRHVSSILAKLGAPSRTAAATYAVQHGLA
jgi:DNA-binding NarL/FixJ family response regulator